MVGLWPGLGRWLVGSSGLPDRIFYFVLGGLIFDIVTILWGLYLLGLAFGRSARFPRHFTIWQIATHRLACWQGRPMC